MESQPTEPMTNHRRTLPTWILTLLFLACAGPAERENATTTVTSDGEYATLTQDLERLDGLFPCWLDRTAARVMLELPAPADGVLAECLYVEGLAVGLGSNDIGLDRGQLGASRVVRFRQVGERVLLEQPNLAFRTVSSDAFERRAGEQSFATSVLWAGEVAAISADGARLVDITDFVVRDAHGSARSMEGSGGSFRLAAERSALLPDSVLAFPDNLEFEALLTFAADGAGREVREVAPSADAVTLVQHHSLVRLPDADYAPLAWDPRAGGLARGFTDLAAHPAEPNRVEYAVRHRLVKQFPERALSPPVEPLVYYVDRGAPEPVRSALVEGARWWNEAFEAAGFEDAFRVELLPEGAHPLDVRYNVIQWVHRSSRGWSYGGGVTDPRSGEQIKGHVSLGSLRVRQDRLIFEGLVGTAGTGGGGPNDPVEAALARIRQLSAHEVGHTLGLAHNFAASTYGRASVMDYPPPRIEVREAADGARTLSLASAYAVGIGAWDRHAISELYRDQRATPRDGARAAQDAGLVYLSDQDARPAGAADPRANLWDDGEDALVGLSNVLAAREVALEAFDAERLADGSATSFYEEVLLPLFLLHRYQVDAAAKFVGGRTYTHALVGDGRPAPAVVPATEQRAALVALLLALPATLTLPENARALLAPRTVVPGRRREVFAGRSAPTFDEYGLAEAAARLVVQPLLVPERLERVRQQAAHDDKQLSVDEVLQQLVAVGSDPLVPADPELRAVLREVVVDELLRLAADRSASARVRAQVESRLGTLLRIWNGDGPGSDATRAALQRRIERFLNRTSDADVPPSAPRSLPPGSPIGCSQGCP